MKSAISPMALTVEDFIGAILPGLIWAVEFFTFKDIVKVLANGLNTNDILMYPSTFDVALSLVSNKENTSLFYVGFGVCSLILGYISNAFPTDLSEKISTYVCRILRVKGHYEKFPYNKQFWGEESLVRRWFTADLCERFNLHVQELNDGDQKVYQHCKKLVKFYAPDHVRDRVMYYESQCRMLSSLLLASIVNVFLLLVVIFIASGKNRFSLLGLLVFSLVTVVTLGYTFHHRRHAEVLSIYSYAYLSLATKQ